MFSIDVSVDLIADSYIITINFHSHLQDIGVEITPASTCLSVDSNFTLANGEGVFPGSICEVAASVTLRFFTTDSQGNTHYTNPTPAITVSGKRRFEQ